MRVLVVSMTFPLPLKSGGRLRVFNLIKRLSVRHKITFLCLSDSRKEVERYSKELEPYCERIDVVPWRSGSVGLFTRLFAAWPLAMRRVPFVVLNKQSRELARRLRDYVESGNFDVVQIEWIHMAQHLDHRHWPFVGRRGILVEHDVTWKLLERQAAVAHGAARWVWRWEATAMGAYEGAMAARFARVVAVSDDDAATLRNSGVDKVAVVPNGVDVEHYIRCFHAKKVAKTLLFVGWFRHNPNVDALRYFLDSVYDRIAERHPDVGLRIVGSHVPGAVERLAARRPSVELVGYVEDVRQELARAMVSVVPLRVGGGTRLKILESMAAGTPVVTTSIGCEGLEIEPGRHLLVGDTPEAFARCVTELLGDDDLRRRMASDARSLVESRYDWSRSADQLEAVYASLV